MSEGVGRTDAARGRGDRPRLLSRLGAELLAAHLRRRHAGMEQEPADLSDVSPAEARLLARAMAAAAHADGEMGEEERERIAAGLRRSQLNPAEQFALLAEVETPPSLEALARRVDDPRLAARFYAVSLTTAGGGRHANRAYLTYLKSRLGLAPDVALRLERSCGVEV